jgi:phytanoyl-CoA hydroxylase
MGLAPHQLEAFATRGWFHLGPVFAAGELAEIRAEYDRCLATPMRIGDPEETPFDYGPLLQLQSERLRRHATSPRLVEPMIELLGPDVRLYWDQAVCKPPGASSPVPWHQDNGYGAVEPAEYATCTLALDANTRENGCLWIQSGSQRHGPRPHARRGDFFYEAEAGGDPGVAVEQPEGDVLVFSSLTLHRTGGNRSPGPRRSWVIQFIPAHATQGDGGAPFDDRLLVARDGRVLDEPVREREFDLTALIRAEARRR